MLLGNEAIKSALESGAIYCDPAPEQIEGTHIDVRIGPDYWVADERIKESPLVIGGPDAEPAYFGSYTLHTAGETQGYIVLPPLTLVLAHTIEYIGPTVADLEPVMSGRSTLARWGVQVHLSAGWGDPGFCGRWTLELINFRKRPVWLPVGSRVASVGFFGVAGCSTLYTREYNRGPGDWNPLAMLPKGV